ncbi:hypothetical protein DSM106972_049860 [Dulcicalothrix desertica PCC 7102]|uniref:Uncharacterized protein n=1 Tax=Dulcicalothrix desertica PCC 7102 TaxID=232991 RepID=A0A3S1IXN1_9CYAN|nr:hypothetical protein [Dulcicalothrix desertica]RUT04072.1 hypothetical protein DSM106972_049860 [Dulcicalothrix desertica PCC 7102]TWH43526.1 hypothetical protein CAL7102_07259 [Dulcicalothrix desertica PCC 7102]
MFQLVDKKQAREKLNLSFTTLKKYRRNGTWVEGIHWVEINCRCIRYNLELIQDWLHNRNDPKAHLRAIEKFRASLASNQRSSGRKQNQN